MSRLAGWFFGFQLATLILAADSSFAVPPSSDFGYDPSTRLPAQAPATPTLPGNASWWDGFDTQGMNGDIFAFAVYKDELVAGGEFTTAGGVPALFIARWNGESWSPLGSGMDGPVRFLAIYDGELIAGGEFTIAGGNPAAYIARWDGNTWGPLDLGMDAPVFALTVHKGNLFAGGAFEVAGRTQASHIAMWDGVAWTALGQGVNDNVFTLASYNGEVIVGGDFTMAGLLTANRIVRWRAPAWIAFGAGANDTVRSLSSTAFLVAGGDFTTIDGVPANHIAVWNQVTWSATGTGVTEAGNGGTVNAMLVYTGKLIVAGLFDQANTIPAENITAFNMILAWSPLGSGLTGGPQPEVKALAVYHGSLYAGGSFQVAGGNPSPHIARWTDPVTYDAVGVTLESNRAPHELSPGSMLGNDIWGYVSPSGREYAMVGLSNGIAFVEVTNPARPIHVGTIPHTSSTWADVKPFDQYAYIVADGTNDGMQIVDLTQIDSGSVELFGSFRGDGLTRAHTIGVNPETEFVYLFGGNLGVRPGILAISVAEPTRPVIAGLWDEHYVHDAQVVSYLTGPYAGREIAFAATTDSGLTIVDVTDKANMFTVSRLVYPGATYCHQGWLSDDRRYFFINDEIDELAGRVTFTTTYVVDVSDIENPELATTFTNGLKVVDHDLMVRGNLVVEANYTSGLRIFDVSNIDQIEEVAYFDTYPENDEQAFNGAWGPYTGLPSGNVIVSDRHRGLFVFSLPENILADPIELLPGPNGASLIANTPNPFQRETSIGFELARPGPVRLMVFSVHGRPVRMLVDGMLGAGPHAATWDGRDGAGRRVPGGVYWYRLDANAGPVTKRMVLIP